MRQIGRLSAALILLLASTAGAQTINLKTQVSGVLPPANGGLGAAPTLADQIPITTSPTVIAFQQLYACASDGVHALTYSSTMHNFACTTLTAGAPSWASVTNGASAATLTMASGGSLAPGAGSIAANYLNGVSVCATTPTAGYALLASSTTASCWSPFSGGSVTMFTAPAGSWPSWLVPTVTNASSTPNLAVAASAIPNSALANSSATVNGQTCTLGATCTIPLGSGYPTLAGPNTWGTGANTFGGTVTAPSVNAVSHVNPSMGDPITTIQAAWTACGNACIVKMDPGTYTSTSSTPLLVSFPTQSLEGDGQNAVTVNYSGGATFLNLQEATFTLSPGPKIGGFTLNCTAANPICMQIGSSIGTDLYDLTVAGPGGVLSNGANSGTCIQFLNTNGWTERWSLDAQVGGCATSVHFATPTGTGTTSYGYGKIALKGGPVGAAILVDSTALLYHMLGITVQYNSNGLQATTTATASSGATSITVASPAGILPGQAVSATGVPSGDVVAQSYTIGSTTVPLTSATTAALSATAVNFYTVMLESAGTINGGNFNLVGESSSNFYLGEVLDGGVINLCGNVSYYASAGIGVSTPIISGNNGGIPWDLNFCNQASPVSIAAGVGTITDYQGSAGSVIVPTNYYGGANTRTSSGYIHDSVYAVNNPYVSVDTSFGGAFCIYGVPSFSFVGNLTQLNCIDSGGNMNVGASSGIKTTSGGGFAGDGASGWNAWMNSGATYGYRFWNGVPGVGPLIAQLTNTGALTLPSGSISVGGGTAIANTNNICQSSGVHCNFYAPVRSPITLAAQTWAPGCTNAGVSSGGSGYTTLTTGIFNITQAPTSGWSSGSLTFLTENYGSGYYLYVCNSSASAIVAAAINGNWSTDF